MEKDNKQADSHQRVNPSTALPPTVHDNQVVRPDDNPTSSPESDYYGENQQGRDDPGKPKIALTRGEWIAVATLIVVFAQALIYYWTLSEIRKTAESTKTAAESTQKQANVAQAQASIMVDQTQAAKTQANASMIQANVSERIVKATATQANASMSQASTSQVSARAAQQATQMAKEARRPVITQSVTLAKLTDDQMDFEIKVENAGGSPVDATLHYCLVVRQSPRIMPTVNDCYRIRTAGPALIPSSNYKIITDSLRSSGWIKAIHNRDMYVFLVTTVSYRDYGEIQQRPSCSVYREEFRAVGDCSDLLELEGKRPANNKHPN
jgi:hypothetical protein